MHRCMACIVVTAFIMTSGNRQSFADEPDLAKLKYPLSKIEKLRAPTFVLDVSEVANDANALRWGESAKELCEEWFHVLCSFLATDSWTPPETVRLVIKKELAAPGVTSGATISCSHKWITEHPDDFGMVIHELTHVVQNYPRSSKNPGWLVEGIADYLRYWKYESEVPHRRIGSNASYRDGYGTTGSFLAWMVWKYDRRVVRKLDDALRKNEYRDDLFKEATGKDLSDLWIEFIAHEQRNAGKSGEN